MKTKRKILVFICCLLLFLPGCIDDCMTEEALTNAVMKHLENKYDKKFEVLYFSSSTLLNPKTSFALCPKGGTESDRFEVIIGDWMHISDGYFSGMIHDEYTEVMNEITDKVCDNYYLYVCKNHYGIWADRYNKNTKITDLYKKGANDNFKSTVMLYIQSTEKGDRGLKEILQPIGEEMVKRKLLGSVRVWVAYDNIIEEIYGKTFEEIEEIRDQSKTLYFVYDGYFTMTVDEDPKSKELVITYNF